jgi:hypothetical protein
MKNSGRLPQRSMPTKEHEFLQARTVSLSDGSKVTVYQPKKKQTMFARITQSGVVQIEMFNEEDNDVEEIEQVEKYDLLAPNVEIAYIPENEAEEYPS